MATDKSPQNVVTGKVRFSYAHVFVPYQSDGEEKPKYSVSLLIPKDDVKTVKAIRKAIQAALEYGKSTKFNGKIPRNYKDPLRDGDEEKEDDENYEGMYFLSAKSLEAPNVVGRDRKPIIDESEFYSGCWGYASLTFYPYNVKNAGVAVALNNLMKSDDGEPLGAKRASAEEDFGEIEIEDFDDEDDDDDDYKPKKKVATVKAKRKFVPRDEDEDDDDDEDEDPKPVRRRRR